MRASLLITFLISVFILTAPVGNMYAQVVINEVMSSNGNTLPDEDGDYEDWIELYNAGSEPVSLHLLGLSDNSNLPFRWVFPDTVIAPHQFILVWASGKNRRVPGGQLHTNFSISAAGEEIVLTNPSGVQIDYVPPVEIPRDISYGRFPDGDESWFFFTDASPSHPNSDSGFLGILPEVTYSIDGGFYNGPVTLSFTSSGRGFNIHYTLDGSEPDEHSAVYSAPIVISDRSDQPNNLSTIRSTIPEDFWRIPHSELFKGTVVRARKIRDGYLPGKINTHTYFKTDEPEPRYQLPVFSISTDSVHFFGHETGIYIPGSNFDGINFQSANYAQRGIEWERPVHIELFENNNRVYSTDAGARIHGGFSRRSLLKSLRLYARGSYGDNRFNYPLFPDAGYSSYNRFILRNSGNDLNQNMFKDGFIQNLVRHLNFDTQLYRPAIMFLNGEYWGILNIRERYDRHYLERVHQVDPDRIDMLTGNALVVEGSSDHYTSMINYIQGNNLTDQAHFDHVSKMMDMDNFIDYFIANIYIKNTDWPGSNIDFWRYQNDIPTDDISSQDGRWRWMMYDTDFGFGNTGPEEDNYTHNTLAFATEAGNTGWPNPDWSTFLLRNLLNNDDFRAKFINRFADLLNSTFNPDHVKALIDRKQNRIEPYMPEHIHRYGIPSSMIRWNENGQRLKRFAENRPYYQRNHLIEHFNLSGLYELTVDVSHSDMGLIRVNSLDIQANDTGITGNPFPWTGTYFRDIPVVVSAVPATDYRFVRWLETGDESSEITIQPDEDIELTAIFEIIGEGGLFPVSHTLSDAPFHFTRWPSDSGQSTFPDHMAFYYMNEEHPGLESEPAAPVTGAYNLNSGTRINGLADGGLSFINAGNSEGNSGYPALKLGAAALALNTLNMDQLQVQFRGGTLQPGSRIYNIRLQYRTGPDGQLTDVLDDFGEPVEYRRNSIAGHSMTIGPIDMPESLNNKPYIQLWWRYYYTGEQADQLNDAASQLRLDDIRVDGSKLISIETEHRLPTEYTLHQNYPNPFNPVTTIQFDLPVPSIVRITVYNMAGQIVAKPVNSHYSAGTHQIDFDASRLASGIYIYRFETSEFTQTRKLMLLK